MSIAIKLITITTQGSWGPRDDWQISLVLKKGTYALRGKHVECEILCNSPQITRKIVKVTAEWANGILDELRNANIPLLPPKVIGCDGSFYSMSVGSVLGDTTYKWWGVSPKGWEILTKITEKIIKEFSKSHY